jgi:hypothetical protein
MIVRVTVTNGAFFDLETPDDFDFDELVMQVRTEGWWRLAGRICVPYAHIQSMLVISAEVAAKTNPQRMQHAVLN